MISDLHLGTSPEGEARAHAFAALVDDAARAPDPGGLLLLGDIFDLPLFVRGAASRRAAVDRWVSQGREGLLRIHDRHPGPAEALRRFGSAGGRLTLVAGNHDLALVQPRVRETLGALVGPVEVRPWIAYVPGVLYAEHGQQYDINAIRTLLDPDPRLAAAGAPLAWAIGAVTGESDLPNRVAALVELVVGPIRTRLAARALADAREEYRREGLDDAVSEIGLPIEVLRQIDRLSAPSLRRTVARVVARIVAATGRRLPAREPFTSELPAIARAIDALLADQALEVPLYVFGHTHRPAIGRLDPGGHSLYANAGAWTRFRSMTAGNAVGPGRYPVLRIDEPTASGPSAALVVWNAAEAREEPYPAADASGS